MLYSVHDNAPPQELNSRSLVMNDLHGVWIVDQDHGKESQFLLPLPRAQRELGANHALRSLSLPRLFAK